MRQINRRKSPSSCRLSPGSGPFRRLKVVSFESPKFARTQTIRWNWEGESGASQTEEGEELHGMPHWSKPSKAHAGSLDRINCIAGGARVPGNAIQLVPEPVGGFGCQSPRGD